MTLFNYFKRANCVKSAGNSNLPDPSGPLGAFTSIEEANKEVAVQNVESREKKRSPYMIMSLLEQKVVVGKHAADYGTTNATHYFAKDFPNLKESTVRGWKAAYLTEQAKYSVHIKFNGS